MERVNAKVGPDDVMSEEVFDQPPPLECWPDYRPEREERQSNVPSVFGGQFLSKRSSNPAYTRPVVENSKLPPTSSDLPDLLPTIEPKLEMLDFMDTMPKIMEQPGRRNTYPGRSNMDMAPPSSNPSDNITEILSDLQYNRFPPARLPQSEQNDLAFVPPPEIFQIMNDFWSADLF